MRLHGGQYLVSIHASAWEATSTSSTGLPARSCFNPRLRMGGDVAGGETFDRARVSIHASAWEATYSIVT